MSSSSRCYSTVAHRSLKAALHQQQRQLPLQPSVRAQPQTTLQSSSCEENWSHPGLRVSQHNNSYDRLSRLLWTDPHGHHNHSTAGHFWYPLALRQSAGARITPEHPQPANLNQSCCVRSSSRTPAICQQEDPRRSPLAVADSMWPPAVLPPARCPISSTTISPYSTCRQPRAAP